MAMQAAKEDEEQGMNEWYPIESAPRDGTPIQAKIPGHGADNIIAWTGGFIDTNGEDASAWVFVEDQEPPQCWTDGVCWEVNEDGNRSLQPTEWKPLSSLPSPPKE